MDCSILELIPESAEVSAISKSPSLLARSSSFSTSSFFCSGGTTVTGINCSSWPGSISSSSSSPSTSSSNLSRLGSDGCWISLCLFKDLESMKDSAQTEQVWGRSPEWTSLWRLKLAESLYAFPQSRHS